MTPEVELAALSNTVDGLRWIVVTLAWGVTALVYWAAWLTKRVRDLEDQQQ